MRSAPQLGLPDLPPPPAAPCRRRGLRVGFLWTSTYDSEFANNVITMLEALWPLLPPACAGAGAGGGRGEAGGGGGASTDDGGGADDRAVSLWWFSVNDGDLDDVGQYRARRRVRALFGDRFVAIQSGEQRPDHTASHEGVEAAAQIHAYALHMLFNLPGKRKWTAPVR